MHTKRTTVVLAATFVLGCLHAGCGNNSASIKAATLKDRQIRHEAPDFVLKDADGKTVRLSDYKGKVILLDFWATSCGPCRVEIPWFTDMEHKKKDQGFEVLGISMDDGWEDVKPFLAGMKVNYRVVMGDELTSRMYGDVEAIPTTFLIDKQGKIAAIHVGLASRKAFEDGVDELLREGSTSAVVE